MELLHWGVARSTGASLLSDVLRSVPLATLSSPPSYGDPLLSLFRSLALTYLPTTLSS